MYLNAPRRVHERGRTRSPQSSARANRFQSIPTELVLLVLDFLPTPDILAFASTCTSLHHVALPVYLERFNCELIWGSPVCPFVSKALSTALFRPKLKKLVYVHCLDGGRLGSLPDEIPRRHGRERGGPMVQKVLEMVDVENVEMHLADVYPKGSGDRAEELLTNASADSHDTVNPGAGANNPTARLVRSVEASVDEWIALLDAFLTKTKCRSLMVEMVTWGTDAETLAVVEEGIVRWRYRPLKYAQRRLKEVVGVPRRWLGLTEPNKLEKLYVHSETLFQPPLLDWTLSNLASSPSLTSVSFDQMHHFGRGTWELLLPCITIPNLKQLSINLCAVYSADLYAFLERHPTIEELRLGRGLPPPDPAVSLPIPKGQFLPWFRRNHTSDGSSNFLPSLRTLVASPEHVVAFLSSPLHPFASVERVVVEYRAKHVGQFTVKGVNHDLAPVCLRLKGVKEVVLQMQSEGCAVDWIVGHGGASTSQSAESSTSRIPLDPHQGLTFVSSCVTTVEFRANVYALPESIAIALPNWLSAFTKLRAFSLRTLASDLPSPFTSFTPSSSSSSSPTSMQGDSERQGAPGRRRGSRGYRVMDIEGQPPKQAELYTNIFLESLVRSCPGVKKVEVDGREVELPTRRIIRLR
ncbi:hypothetical protein NMY22_g9336 [Coprinellus aureogranulatus]|nr:hypothetical protein NMY22_g9336 [Coprinellus aureogranulatus]